MISNYSIEKMSTRSREGANPRTINNNTIKLLISRITNIVVPPSDKFTKKLKTKEFSFFRKHLYSSIPTLNKLLPPTISCESTQTLKSPKATQGADTLSIPICLSQLNWTKEVVYLQGCLKHTKKTHKISCPSQSLK